MQQSVRRELFDIPLPDGGSLTGEICEDGAGFVFVRNENREIIAGSGFRGEERAAELLTKYMEEFSS